MGHPPVPRQWSAISSVPGSCLASAWPGLAKPALAHLWGARTHTQEMAWTKSKQWDEATWPLSLTTHGRLHGQPAAQTRHASDRDPGGSWDTPGPGAEGTICSLSESPSTRQHEFEALGGLAAKTSTGFELQRSCLFHHGTFQTLTELLTLGRQTAVPPFH